MDLWNFDSAHDRCQKGCHPILPSSNTFYDQPDTDQSEAKFLLKDYIQTFDVGTMLELESEDAIHYSSDLGVCRLELWLCLWSDGYCSTQTLSNGVYYR